MKKIFTIIALSLLSVAAMAQYCFGIKAGFNTSLGLNRNWQYDNTSFQINDTETYGFNVGLMARFGYRAFAQIEVDYHFETSLKNIGNAFKSVVDRYTPVEPVKDHWINVPVMFGIRLVQVTNFNWYLLAGPSFNFHLNNGTTTQYQDPEGNIITSNARPVTFGLDCGTGFDIWFFTLELRYKLMQNSYIYSTGDVKINTNANTNPEHAFEVAIAFRFADKMNR
ncbi:MAG: PorT family protein [Paludibacteraceae bacterium]|nr:PorT family protein [Paludibacteraceae bacterium]MBQ1851983.1 PorT family protein [Paludibacteraceae bacterium]MBQ2064763.1 PorT family protein [Paludibacteraceae bacterium]